MSRSTVTKRKNYLEHLKKFYANMTPEEDNGSIIIGVTKAELNTIIENLEKELS